MPAEHIQPLGLFKPPTYAQVVKAGNIVYIAGQVAQDEHGQVVGRGDFMAQATQVFENLRACLASVGAGFEDLVKINVFLTDARYRPVLVEVRSKFLRDPLPASTLVVVAGLAEPEYLLEIEGVAILRLSA